MNQKNQKAAFIAGKSAGTFTSSLVLCTGGITMKPLTPVLIAVATLVVVASPARRGHLITPRLNKPRRSS